MKAKEKGPAQVVIDSLNLTIGGRTLQLGMDEARRLHAALAGVFGSHSCACRYPTSWYTYSNTGGDSVINKAVSAIFNTSSDATSIN